jgi:protein-L-isoaspartate(D-aspartate) O-methyltransferase
VRGQQVRANQALAVAFDKGGAERVTGLHRRDDLPEDQCWLRAPGWCLAVFNLLADGANLT